MMDFTGNGKRILIVEDDGIIATHLYTILAERGYALASVASGEESIQQSAAARPDLVLMDIHLAGEMDGVQAAGKIRARFGIPVIYLTAYSGDALLERAKITEPYSYLVKPVQERELFAVIEMALYKHEMESELEERERYFRSLLFHLHEDILVIDRDYCITDTNKAFLINTGRERKEVIGRHCYEVSHGYDEPCHKKGDDCLLLQVFETGQSFTCRHAHTHVDGSKVWVDILMSPLPDEQGNITRVIEAVRDVTPLLQTQEALRKSEAELCTIFDSAPSMMILVDQELRVRRANRNMAEIANRSANELTGLRGGEALRCIYALDDPGGCGFGPVCQTCTVRNTVLDTFETGAGHHQIEAKLWLAQGEGQNERDILVSTTLIESLEGTSVLVCIDDVTTRKRAEESLRESEEFQRTLLEASPDYIFVLDANGTVLRANRLHPDHREQDIIGQRASMFVLPEYQDAFERAIRQAADTRQLQTVEVMADLPDGQHYFLVRLNPVHLAGEEGSVVLIGTDITERMQAEEERERLAAHIHAEAQRVQQIITTVPEGVVLLDGDGRVMLANPVAERDLAVLSNAKVGDTLTHLGDRPLHEILASPPVRGLWHEAQANRRIFEIIARPMENDPRLKDWVLVINDVTQEREIERRTQQRERLVSVGQLAAGIAHDFNNIMAAITLYAQMTERATELPAIVRERMQTITQQARHATRLIQQILDFGRRAVLERRPLDLTPLLQEQVRLLERTLPENISINLIYGTDEYAVNADPTRMQQAITNLAVNARDVMPEGGELCIRLERIQVKELRAAPLPDMQVGEWVIITVLDTGTGIPPDVLPHIFDPFFTTKAPGQGSGLGLAQVHGIVAQHEGQIDVETRVGEGTTFIIYLPALSVRQPQIITQAAVPLQHGQGQTILMVEDNAITRKALVESLELLNYRVLEAANGQEALALFDQYANDSTTGDAPGREIALVLSDVVMPGMGGRALFQELRDSDVKVVLLTGHPLQEELESLQAQGLDGWLLKPPVLEQLAEMIARVLAS